MIAVSYTDTKWQNEIRTGTEYLLSHNDKHICTMSNIAAKATECSVSDKYCIKALKTSSIFYVISAVLKRATKLKMVKKKNED